MTWKVTVPATESRTSRTALITGSGRQRLGSLLAHSLAAEGYRIALHYHTSEAAATATVTTLQEQGVDAVALTADVTCQDQVDQMFTTCIERFGQLDVLVTTAANWEPSPLESLSAAQLRHSFEVNTMGTALCCRAAGLIMAEQATGGSIITVGDWAIERPYPDYLSYFISKGAIPAMTRALAVDLAGRNRKVRVNCIHPGPLLFPPGLSPEERQQVKDASLLKKADCPEAFHQAVKFLINNEFVTGVCLPVDGGRTILPTLG
jgi:pteridine reductase